MRKRQFIRLGGVATTLLAVAALISTVVASSGAYFSDAKGGAISGNLGTVAVDISGENINFANVMPGETQTQTVWVRNTGTGNEDIYLAFDNTNYAWSAVNDLGQFGKFVINGQTYDNLNNKYPNGTPGSGFMPGTCSSIPRNAINYLPHVIKLGTLSPGQLWSFDISFQLNACKSTGEGADMWSVFANDFSPPLTGPLPLNFEIAAFQPGVDPNDQFNGAGRIAPLQLPIPNFQPGIYQ